MIHSYPFPSKWGKKEKQQTYQQSVTVFIAFHCADNHINPNACSGSPKFCFHVKSPTMPWEIITTKLVQQTKAQSSYCRSCLCYCFTKTTTAFVIIQLPWTRWSFFLNINLVTLSWSSSFSWLCLHGICVNRVNTHIMKTELKISFRTIFIS